MIHFFLRMLLLGAAAVGVIMLLIHVFPAIVVLLVLIGLVKLYEMFRGPKYPPGRR